VSLLYVALKDLRLALRDPVALLFQILVPVVVITIVAASLGGSAGSSIRLPVVNDDEGPVAEVLIELLGEHVEVTLVDRERAEQMVGRENRAAAALVLPERLSKRYLGSRPSTLLLLTDPGKGSEIDVIKAILMIVDRDAAALADPLSEQLLTLDEQNVSGKQISNHNYEQNVPGFSVMFVLMGVLFGVAFGLQDEKDCGAITRLRAAPVPVAALLSGKLLARFVLGVVQMLVFFVYGHWMFGLSLGASTVAFVALSLAVVFAMTSFSLLVAAFARSREQIIPLGLTVIMIVCSIGGCWWPLFMEPPWLQQLAHLFLTAWSMDGLNDLILRDRGLLEILPTLGALTAYGAVSLALGLKLYRLDGR
jgi:ABC-2 type transport system permease protein